MQNWTASSPPCQKPSSQLQTPRFSSIQQRWQLFYTRLHPECRKGTKDSIQNYYESEGPRMRIEHEHKMEGYNEEKV